MSAPVLGFKGARDEDGMLWIPVVFSAGGTPSPRWPSP